MVETLGVGLPGKADLGGGACGFELVACGVSSRAGTSEAAKLMTGVGWGCCRPTEVRDETDDDTPC